MSVVNKKHMDINSNLDDIEILSLLVYIYDSLPDNDKKTMKEDVLTFISEIASNNIARNSLQIVQNFYSNKNLLDFVVNLLRENMLLSNTLKTSKSLERVSIELTENGYILTKKYIQYRFINNPSNSISYNLFSMSFILELMKIIYKNMKKNFFCKQNCIEISALDNSDLKQLSCINNNTNEDQNFQNFLIKVRDELLTINKLNLSETINTYGKLLCSAFSKNFPSLSKNESYSYFTRPDNFDTGDSCAQPFESFVRGVQTVANEINSYRQYQTLGNIQNGIENVILSFCKQIGWLDENTLSTNSDLRITIGAGTTQLWDFILRTLIVRQGDIILVPAPTYGLFLPQIEMIGGKIILIPLLKIYDYKLNIDQLKSIIHDINLKLAQNWLNQLLYRIKSLISTNNIQNLLTSIDNKLKILITDLNSLLISEQIEDICILEYFEIELRKFLNEINILSKISKTDFNFLLPSRIVGLLHINPSIFGSIYDKNDLISIGKICEKEKICIIDDLAYALLQYSINNQFNPGIATFHNILSIYPKLKVFLLFSLSKPFAIADVRVGIVIARKELIEQINSIIESTIVFIPNMLQSGIFSLFSTEYVNIMNYLSINSSEFMLKRNILLVCICGKDKLKDICHSIDSSIHGFNQTKLDEALLIIREIFQIKKFSKILTESFITHGLSNYFELTYIPLAGFFLIINCELFLKTIGFYYNMKTSFEVALFLSYFYRIRVIPEELMGLAKDKDDKSKLLRLSYSIQNESIVTRTFAIFNRLSKLKLNLQNISATNSRHHNSLDSSLNSV